MPLNSFNESNQNQHSDYAAINNNDCNNNISSHRDDIQNLILSSLNLNSNNKNSDCGNSSSNAIKINS